MTHIWIQDQKLIKNLLTAEALGKMEAVTNAAAILSDDNIKIVKKIKRQLIEAVMLYKDPYEALEKLSLETIQK